jgi:L-fuconolactonase
MPVSRRSFLAATAGALAAHAWTSPVTAHAEQGTPVIIDTHQHLWNLERLQLPWLQDAPAVLKRSYNPEDYAEATRGLDVRAVYMEVDVDTADHDKEAEYVTGLCQSADSLTRAAVIGGRPASESFGAYIQRQLASGKVRGVRQVLHNPGNPAGVCLAEAFVRGVRLLGDNGLMFDLCMRPGELRDGIRLSELCPDTRFVLDHCGNADVKAFHPSLRGEQNASHDVEAWKRDIAAFSQRPNVVCKISGIVASAPAGWKPEHLAPIVDHCLDAFGPDRVVFGGDWPVCLLGSPYRGWVDALTTIIASRPDTDRQKLWSGNARRIYQLADA